VKKIGVGIVGFGRIGSAHSDWIGASGGLRVEAVADATPARQAVARGKGFRVHGTVEKLLGDAAVEAVLVATPTAMHFGHVMAALAAGKHVLVEKPMALDLAESKKMVEEAARRGRVLSVFQNRRWDIDALTVKAAIDSGILGKLINIESRLGQFSSCVGPAAREYRPGWRNEKAFGGGGLYDWGSHFVDQVWRMMEPAKPVRVYAQLRGNVWSSDCDDFARVLIDFDNGVAALVEINTTTARPLPRWHLDGVNGSASSPPSPAFDTHVWAQLKFTPSGGGAEQPLPLAPRGLTETEIWDQFAAAVRGEGEPAVTAESALMTMRLLDAARLSSAEGRAVEI
jgi:scyllo-inositol 2-dehydrogenase (NADP+)